jgi:hypothetical protein
MVYFHAKTVSTLDDFKNNLPNDGVDVFCFPKPALPGKEIEDYVVVLCGTGNLGYVKTLKSWEAAVQEFNFLPVVVSFDWLTSNQYVRQEDVLDDGNNSES